MCFLSLFFCLSWVWGVFFFGGGGDKFLGFPLQGLLVVALIDYYHAVTALSFIAFVVRLAVLLLCWAILSGSVYALVTL